MSLTLYMSSVSGNTEIKKKQDWISSILTAKKISFKAVDICQDASNKEQMRRIVGDPKALPPQICKGDVYVGGYEEFQNAIEEENLEAFLKL